MSARNELETALLALLGIAVLSKVADLFAGANDAFQSARAAASAANDALQQGGARLYEAVHPDERNHANDLPGRRMPPAAILAIATLVGFPDPKLAAAVAMGESLGYVNAINRSSIEYSVGLWQINTKVHPFTPEDMRDPMKNAQAALWLYKRKGWQPWAAYTKGRYKQFRTGVLAP